MIVLVSGFTKKVSIVLDCGRHQMVGSAMHELGASSLRVADVSFGDDVDDRLNPLFIAPSLRGKASIERRSKQNRNTMTMTES